LLILCLLQKKSQSIIASQTIDNRVASITIFGDFRYPNYSSARMGKQKVLSRIKNNHFDTKVASSHAPLPKSLISDDIMSEKRLEETLMLLIIFHRRIVPRGKVSILV